jgi:TusA-related sulfurtransferase
VIKTVSRGAAIGALTLKETLMIKGARSVGARKWPSQGTIQITKSEQFSAFGRRLTFVGMRFWLNAPTLTNEPWEMSLRCENQTLDIRGYLSPLSVLKVKSVLNKMKHGQILEVWSNDSETKVVLEQIIKNSTDVLLGFEKMDEYEKIYIKRLMPGGP